MRPERRAAERTTGRASGRGVRLFYRASQVATKLGSGTRHDLALALDPAAEAPVAP